LSEIDNEEPRGGDDATDEPWPSVLSYWRIISAEAFDEATKAEVIAFVRGTTSTIPEWQRATSGDAEAAIRMVMHCKAPASISVRVDFPMTVLLSCAWEEPAAAFTLSSKLREMPLEEGLRTRLATSWHVAGVLAALRLARRRHLRGGES
jgi:hypothetical protein